MAFPRSLTASRILGLSLVLGGVACSAMSEDDGAASQDAALEAQFDKNNVVSDEELQASTMTEAQIQRFLDKTPYGSKSALAAYKENGKTAAEILFDAAATYKISPLALLARIQTEQGLISKTTASKSVTDIAFGCGCPDSASCGPKYYGLANQAACAAGSMRRSLDRQTAGGTTISGWKRGTSKKTLDQLDIMPQNAATATLYTYTPWVGEAGGGKTGVGGTSLYFKVLKRFTDAHLIATTGSATGDAGPTTTDAGAPTKDAQAPAKDAGPVRDGGSCNCQNPDFPICDTASNTCVGCLQDSHCAGGDVCDTTLKKCVECTTGKTANCDVDGAGSACMPNKTCGCNSDTDCGTATSGRVCGASKVCTAGCRGTGGNRCPAGQTCSSTTSAIGTCGGGGGNDAGPPPADAGTEPEPPVEPPVEPPTPGEDPAAPSAEDPDLEGGDTPVTNSAPPPQRDERSNLASGAGPDLELGRQNQASGCSTRGTGSSGSGALLAVVGIAVLAGSRRREKRA